MTNKFEPRPPTVYTPFLRRFTDERATDLRETKQLHTEVRTAWLKTRWPQPDALGLLALLVLDTLEERATLSDSMRDALTTAIENVLKLETAVFTSPDIEWDTAVLSLKEHVELRRSLRAQQHFLANEARVMTLLHDALVEMFRHIVEAFPNTGGTATFTTPLIDRLPDAAKILERIFVVLGTQEVMDAGLFADIFDRCHRNACAFSGVPPYQDNAHKIIGPTKAKLSPPDLISTYVAGTPLFPIFQTPVPFAIPRKTYASHGVILAPPNHGKSQLLGAIIHGFLNEPDPIGMCVLDPHGDLFDALRDRVEPSRLVVLDPDTKPPALNFLDFGASTPAETLQTFAYLMSSLSGGLSDKQGAIVPYLLKVLQKIPGASLETLRIVVDEKVKGPERSQFAGAIKALPPIDQGFFANQFYAPRMQETKDAIGWKLYSALSSDAFRTMFSAAKNSFDADAAMRERKVVLVKGARSALGDEGMSVFLQFIVSQFFSAALRRHRVPPEQRHLFMLLADEAHHLFNTQTSNILTECRKYGLGFMAATQVVQQIPDDVKAAIYGATAIKIAGPVSHSDAQVLAREMYTTGDFIRSMKAVERSHADFAFHVAGMTEHAVRVRVPYGTLERMPKQKAVLSGDKPLSPSPASPLPASVQTEQNVPQTVDTEDDFYTSPMKGV